MRHNALRAVLHAGWQGGIAARAVKEKEGAVAEEAGMPVFKPVARQKFAFEIYKVFIVHLIFLDVLFFCYVADKVVGLCLVC